MSGWLERRPHKNVNSNSGLPRRVPMSHSLDEWTWPRNVAGQAGEKPAIHMRVELSSWKMKRSLWRSNHRRFRILLSSLHSPFIELAFCLSLFPSLSLCPSISDRCDKRLIKMPQSPDRSIDRKINLPFWSHMVLFMVFAKRKNTSHLLPNVTQAKKKVSLCWQYFLSISTRTLWWRN